MRKQKLQTSPLPSVHPSSTNIPSFHCAVVSVAYYPHPMSSITIILHHLPWYSSPFKSFRIFLSNNYNATCIMSFISPTELSLLSNVLAFLSFHTSDNSVVEQAS
ncbi:hypothetical protein Syun_009963 [Stephania yunnanensis]|uniref:Uncharacterized protein n=1 Tax=Stephania yunnanensis TaxID=152371 RepID=A0AAP0KHF9_9MAGN